MGELADRVDTMRVTATTYDGAVTAELHDRDRLTVSFRRGVYDACSEDDLQRYLTVLASRLWVARTREYRRIWGDVTGDDPGDEDSPQTEVDRAWRDERDRLVAFGCSGDGWVEICVVGMRSWHVTVHPGAVRALDQRQFVVAVEQAATALVRDQFARIAELSRRHYGRGS